MKHFEGNPTNARGGYSSSPPCSLPLRFGPSVPARPAVGGLGARPKDPLDSLKLPSNPRNSMSVDSSKGLANKPGENNCFMNCPVQILWHLNSFRKNFRLLIAHVCTGDDCIFCSLKFIYTNYQFSERPILSSETLRRSMATAFTQQQKFQLGSMDDASECYETILECLHDHLVVSPNDDDDDDDDGDGSSPPCSAPHCLPHRKMSLLVAEKTTCSCGSTSDIKKSLQPIYHVSTTAVVNQLRSRKSSQLVFAQKLNKARVQSGHRPCSDGGCNRQAQRVQILLNDPEVVTIGFVWDSEQVDSSHSNDIINSIQPFITARDLFHETSQVLTSSLEMCGLLCYHSKHYCVFLLHPKQKVWFLYDDDCITKLDDKLDSVKTKCCKENLQPLLLLYCNNKTPTPIDTSTNLRATIIRPLKRARRGRERISIMPSRRGEFRGGKQGRRQSHSPNIPGSYGELFVGNSNPPIALSSRSSHSSSSATSDVDASAHITRKKVRFRREVEGLTTDGRRVVSSLKGPTDGPAVISVPVVSGALHLGEKFDQKPAGEHSKNQDLLKQGRMSFSQMSKEFLTLSSIAEEESGQTSDYIDPRLVTKVISKTMAKPHSGIYTSASSLLANHSTPSGPMGDAGLYSRSRINSNQSQSRRTSYEPLRQSQNSNGTTSQFRRFS